MFPSPKTIRRVFAVLLALLAASAWADVLELRDGQTLTGQYAGGSKEEVRFQVGSQTLRFPLAEVSRLTIGTAAQAGFQRAAKDALRQLKALASVTEGGTTYQNYSSRVEDAKIKIDQFLDEHQSSPMPKFNERIAETLSLYVAASLAWNTKVARGTPAGDPYLIKCPAAQELLVREHATTSEKGPGAAWVILGYRGVPLLWECAHNALLDAEKAIGR